MMCHYPDLGGASEWMKICQWCRRKKVGCLLPLENDSKESDITYNFLCLYEGGFRVVGLVSKPLSKCEVEVDFVVIQISFLFIRKIRLKNTS